LRARLTQHLIHQVFEHGALALEAIGADVGHVYKDFYYKFQLEVNGAPGENKGPRVLDAFIEWQKYDFLRVRLGQFKRSFGFENPMSPLAIGGGVYSQATPRENRDYRGKYGNDD
jgi:hypothetical protein